MIIIKKILLILLLFFNTLEVDSNSDKYLFYDRENIYEEDYHVIYFNNVNSIVLNEVLNNLNIEVHSYIVDGKKYYVRNMDELIDKYVSDKELKDKIYYENKGINIDGISVSIQNGKVMELENELSIY